MDLKACLRQQQQGPDDWRQTVGGIRIAAERIWQRPRHRDYTDHSVQHSERIIEKLGQLIDDLVQLGSVSPDEVYILLAAAYLHDIGMQDQRWAGLTPGEVREIHHQLTYDIISSGATGDGDAVPLGMEHVPVDIVDTVARVCRAHRRTDLADPAYEEFTHGASLVRPRFLAALLRLADELDIDYRRVDTSLLSLMPITANAELYWRFCRYVSGVRIEGGLITIFYQFPEEGYSKIIAPLITRKIEAELAVLKTTLWKDGCKVHMSEEPLVRIIPRLDRMPSEVLALASRQHTEWHSQSIAYHEHELRIYTSMTPASVAGTPGEAHA